MFLAGYGGMVSLSQMTVAGIAGYAVAIFGVSTTPEGVVLGWPWWLAVTDRDRGRHARRDADRLALGAHRRHLHDHDHARGGRGVLLPRAAELQRARGLPGLPEGLSAGALRARLARTRAVLLPRALLGARGLLRREVPGARALRAGAPGHARQPAAHGGARLRRERASHRRPRPGGRAGRGRRRALRLVPAGSSRRTASAPATSSTSSSSR